MRDQYERCDGLCASVGSPKDDQLVMRLLSSIRKLRSTGRVEQTKESVRIGLLPRCDGKRFRDFACDADGDLQRAARVVSASRYDYRA